LRNTFEAFYVFLCSHDVNVYLAFSLFPRQHVPTIAISRAPSDVQSFGLTCSFDWNSYLYGFAKARPANRHVPLHRRIAYQESFLLCHALAQVYVLTWAYWFGPSPLRRVPFAFYRFMSSRLLVLSLANASQRILSALCIKPFSIPTCIP